MKFALNKSFVTVSEQTSGTLLVSQSFGLGLDVKREFPVLHDLQIDLRPSDVVCICGDSGGGKSTLLKQLSESVQKAGIFGSIAVLDQIKVSEDEILIDNAGNSFEPALRNLSLSGLSDAFLLIRKYRELSDGQRYRYKIAKLLDSKARTWVADEFLSTLDRDTAKVVAYCVQKLARRIRNTLIVATAHEDLIEDLKPTIIIRKGFGSKCVIEYRNETEYFGQCSLSKEIVFREGTRDDYQQLHEFHYRAELPNNTHKIFTLELGREPIGCITYGTAPLASSARHAFMGYHVLPGQLNKEFINISRVVIHPKFRSIGLGANLVRESLTLVSKKYVETTAVMAKFNPFFEKAGMKRVPSEPDSTNVYKNQIKDLENMGVSLSNLSEIGSISSDQYLRICEYLSKSENYFSLTALYGHDAKIDRSKLVDDLINNRQFVIDWISKISILSQDKAYFIWRNPAIQ